VISTYAQSSQRAERFKEGVGSRKPLISLSS
jgi:hypothetical protein